MEDYASASRARREDVRVLVAAKRDLAAIYIVGYVAECELKALLRIRGAAFPTSGQAGHNLRGLWSAAGFRLRDAGEYGSAFLATWTTGLRYKAALPAHLDSDRLMKGADAACTLVARRHRDAQRNARRRSRRGH